jgi:arylsulfatase A-like enzyme
MPRKPDLIIFNPDQWRGDVLGHTGNAGALTPNIDRLVRSEAVSFRNAFCQNPVCTPSRCSFMTGWYPHVRGHRSMHHMLHSEHGEPNLLEILKENDYLVWWGGKNDLVPGGVDFGRYCDMKYTPPEVVDPIWQIDRQASWRGEPDGDKYYSFYIGRLPHSVGWDHYHDTDWANVLGAIEFLRNYQGEQPMCIYLPLTYPHPPYAVEEPWYSAIERGSLPPRQPTPANWRGKPSILKGIAKRQHLEGWNEARWTELRATYYGMCARLDHQFGLLLEALHETGRYADSAIFLFSDHGDFTGDYGLVEKTQNTFEDPLTNVPFILKPPEGIAVRPRVSQALVELVDFPATVFDLTGIQPGYSHFGKSLLPLLAEEGEHRQAVFCEGGRLAEEEQAMEKESQATEGTLYWPRVSLQAIDNPPYHTKATMCRTAEYKYVRRLYEADELYDLREDPGELNNVAGEQGYQTVLTDLKERLLIWYMETCDVLPTKVDRRW